MVTSEQIAPGQAISAEAFFQIAALPENADRRLELEDGEIVEMAASTPINSVTASRIGYFINAFVIPRDLGYVTGADGGFKLGTNRVRQPDVGFISKTRAATLPKRFSIAPDLAVEVVSPDEDIFKKAREYLSAGTRQVWAVYTDEQAVYIITRASSNVGNDELRVQAFTLADTLDGGEVLPGFSLPVRDLFPT